MEVASRPRLAVTNSINPSFTPNISENTATGPPSKGRASSTFSKITLKSFKF